MLSKLLLKLSRFFKQLLRHKPALRYKKKLKSVIEEKKFKPLQITQKKSPLFIVTLTSYGKRTEDTAPYAIWSLFEQNIHPDKIILWLDKENWNLNNIPALLKIEMEMGLEIKFCEDLKSYKKLNFALQEFPNDVLITIDDDAYYPKDWLEKLLQTHSENPEKICFHRAHAIRKGLPYNKWKWRASESDNADLLFPTGIGGVLYPPNSLDVSRLHEFMQLAPQADDIAYWALAKLKGTKHILVKNGYFEFALVNGMDCEDSLMATNRDHGKNDSQFNATVKFLNSYQI
ncbi:MAG: glycosyltransferase family 2 protein [Fibromonadales bacterium]|nr:glycosyltransferase family 2 protein [Fibromonadales bacterium]